jgi:hypothetical protein
MTTEELADVKQMHRNGAKPSFILKTLQDKNKKSVMVMKDIYNLLQSMRQEELGGLTPIEWLWRYASCFIMIKLLTNLC